MGGFSPAAPPDGEPAAATGSSRVLAPRSAALVVGGLTGALGLVAMVRLTSGAFPAGMSGFAWVVVLAAMVPWVAYVALRARHSRLSLRGLVAVAALVLVGFAAVWLSVYGPVLALSCSLVAFVVVWVSDWPERRPGGEEHFVRIEELRGDDDGR